MCVCAYFPNTRVACETEESNAFEVASESLVVDVTLRAFHIRRQTGGVELCSMSVGSFDGRHSEARVSNGGAVSEYSEGYRDIVGVVRILQKMSEYFLRTK